MSVPAQLTPTREEVGTFDDATVSPARDLKTDLLRPEAYGSLQPARVELVETHISWVFLLEKDVFKVKRPVDLGFLDFRSLEQRRIACEAEVRLNARLAPDVYLGVVPVRRGEDGRCSIGDSGTIVDFAVHMVRLRDELRADQLLERQELSIAAVDSLSERLATFHDRARADAETAPFGAPLLIRQNLEENFAQTRANIGEYLSQSEAAEIASWQSAFLSSHQDQFEARVRNGRIRDGHGDLRLEHVYFRGGPPTIIDCIEFNNRFRFGDVCSDVAFLSMDLARSGRVDLAERLLASYARESNDFDLYTVVDFYESYRAFVRGKVAAMTAADPTLDAHTRDRARQQARRHFLLALAAKRQSLVPPMLVAVAGLIASGKSTVAARIAAELSAPTVEADRTRKGMLNVPPHYELRHDAWQGAYAPELTEQVYAELMRRARVVLASGRPVVIDASFRSRSTREAARALAEQQKVPFLLVECRVDLRLAETRLRARERSLSISDGRLAMLDAFRASFEPVLELDPAQHVVVDTARPLGDNMTRLRRRLHRWPNEAEQEARPPLRST
jgi:aminoglycoside phosphotransferase family enzyme/predicted kinase